MSELVNGLNTAGQAFVALAGSMLLQSSVLIVILAALDLLLRKRVKAVVRHWIWLLVLAKLLLPPSLSSPTSLISWAGNLLPETAWDRQSPDWRSSVPLRRAALPGAASPPQAVTVPEAAPLPPAAVQPTALPTWQALVLLGWMIAVLLMGALLIQRISFVRGLMRQSEEAPDSLRVLLEQCRWQMGLDGRVEIRLSCLSASPCVCGLRRPMILIPEQMLRQLRTPQLRSVLFHELAHVRRGDLWLSLVQTLLQIVYLYHLPLWWANARIRAIREQAVDETALAALGQEAEEYPRTLLHVSKLAFGRPALSLRLLGVVESEEALMARIQHMVSRPFPQNARIGARGLAALVVAALVLLPMARGTSTDQAGTAEPELVDSLQSGNDDNLAELIRTAVANHAGAGRKAMREVTQRVTQSYAQILSLDQQIEEAAAQFQVSPGSIEAQRPLRRTLEDLEKERLAELARLGAVMGVVPRPPGAPQPTANLQSWLTFLILPQGVIGLDCLEVPPDYRIAGHQVRWVLLSKKQTLHYLPRRWRDGKSLPMHVRLYYVPETGGAARDLRQRIVALAGEANVDLDGAVDLEFAPWMGLGVVRFCASEGRRWSLPSQRGPRPEGGPRLLDNGQVDLHDLEQDLFSQIRIPDIAMQAISGQDEVSRAWPDRLATSSKRE